MRNITGETSLVALLGQPVSHSLSPIMHNTALEEMGLNWCYIAIPCETNDLDGVIKALRKMNCQGLNITIPFKKDVLKLCQEVSPIANEIQAVNTLIPNQSLGWSGTNTDIQGFLKPLNDKDLKGKNALVLGCGGSARAVVAGLKKRKLNTITIISRNKNSLNNFLLDINQAINNLNLEGPNISGRIHDEVKTEGLIKCADLIVNTTPVGMQTKNQTENLMPFGEKIWQNLESKTILYDLIYNPRPTKWLKFGAEKDCFIIDGLEMLINQGAESLKLWSGFTDIPIEKMKSSAIKHLKS